jgi:hypothetical protein
MIAEVEHMLSMCETLGSFLNTERKGKKENNIDPQVPILDL